MVGYEARARRWDCCKDLEWLDMKSGQDDEMVRAKWGVMEVSEQAMAHKHTHKHTAESETPWMRVGPIRRIPDENSAC